MCCFVTDSFRYHSTHKCDEVWGVFDNCFYRTLTCSASHAAFRSAVSFSATCCGVSIGRLLPVRPLVTQGSPNTPKHPHTPRNTPRPPKRDPPKQGVSGGGGGYPQKVISVLFGLKSGHKPATPLTKYYTCVLISL